MIVYSATKGQFRADVMTNDIGGIILETFEARTGRSTGDAEIQSWVNSLQYMDRVLDDNAIPEDAGVAIEYHIPLTSKRIDFILSGRDGEKQDTAVLVELKQWERATRTEQDAVVRTQLQRREVNTLHPSYQAWSYKKLLEDFNQTVQDERIQLYPCAYLHNYEPDDCLTHAFYAEHIERAPLFLKNDALKLRAFIKRFVRFGDTADILYRIDHGKIKPSKNLADQLDSLLKGNEEFTLVDDQKVAFEAVLSAARRAVDGQKQALIVEGGPGTGKSVVAINLLVAMTSREIVARYVTRNSAPRLVYEARLTRSMKKSHISNMFSGSGSFHDIESDTFGCLIVDEAHRLNEKSGLFHHLGENQIREIIRASRCSVFFLDEDQKVTLKDIGEKRQIHQWARIEGAVVTELALESQFRCNGSNGYLAWLDNALQIRSTANETLDPEEYNFRIFDSPQDLHEWIHEKNRIANRARMVAGYCWDWISKKHPELRDIVIGSYAATWNLDSHGQAWIIQPNSVNEVGCIHTCQGLELDYVGVIVGEDLVARRTAVVTRPEKRSNMDRSIQGWRKLSRKDPAGTAARLAAIIKNTYRTLMTRGQKGCGVYFVDPETRSYFEGRIGQGEATLMPYFNALPLLTMRAVADSSYLDLDGYFSNSDAVVWRRVAGGPFPKDRFLARAEGDSMEPRIRDGQLCLFRRDPGGSRNGKIVLCRIESFAGDAPVAVIKRYRSARIPTAESIGEARAIILSSENDRHDDIVFTRDEHLSIMGVFERVVD
ncbi:MAG TPA: DNA/RNA helicase domain-containing protein [Terriglobia bacterium]|nr:DNA/RNA helicase domain-containing protein [Terriglobia bacterium]